MKKKRKKACNCDVCRDGIEVVMRRQAQLMEEYGFVIDIVIDDATTRTGFNAHTHGLVENFDHPNLQIVMRLPPSLAAGIIEEFVDRIKQGARFKAGDRVYLNSEARVLFVDAVECERPVLRIILPDERGNLDIRDMRGEWRLQYDESPVAAGQNGDSLELSENDRNPWYSSN